MRNVLETKQNIHSDFTLLSGWQIFPDNCPISKHIIPILHPSGTLILENFFMWQGTNLFCFLLSSLYHENLHLSRLLSYTTPSTKSKKCIIFMNVHQNK